MVFSKINEYLGEHMCKMKKVVRNKGNYIFVGRSKGRRDGEIFTSCRSSRIGHVFKLLEDCSEGVDVLKE